MNGTGYWVIGSHLRVETHAILWLWFGVSACGHPLRHTVWDGGVDGGSLDVGNTGTYAGGAGIAFSKVSEALSAGCVPSLR